MRSTIILKIGKFSTQIALAFLFSILMISTVSAATITITNNFPLPNIDNVTPSNGECTLREAINNANANADTTGNDCVAGTPGLDTVQLPSGVIYSTTLLLGQFSITDDINITGSGSPNINIDGGNLSRIFDINIAVPSTISSISYTFLQHGAAGLENGGAIRIANNQQLSMVFNDISNSHATNGGAIYLGDNSTLSFSSTAASPTAIFNNIADVNGGGIATGNNTQITSDAMFLGTNSAVNGGGMFVGTNSAVHLNQGGWIQFNYNDNTASNNGGAFYFDNGSSLDTSLLSNIQMNFNNNSALNQGGAIYFDGGTGNIFDLDSSASYPTHGVNFNNNSAVSSGGAIYQNSGDLILNNICFGCSSANTSLASGGAIFQTPNTNLTITDGAFNLNTAFQGGAISSHGDIGLPSVITINGTDFDSNSVNNIAASGGAISLTENLTFNYDGLTTGLTTAGFTGNG